MKAQSALFTLPYYNPGTPRAFDSLEVHTVAASPDGHCERLRAGEYIAPGEEVFFSLYGFTPDEGSECIGDFTSFEAACELAVRLGGDPA